jgi:hypothetical protein
MRSEQSSGVQFCLPFHFRAVNFVSEQNFKIELFSSECNPFPSRDVAVLPAWTESAKLASVITFRLDNTT